MHFIKKLIGTALSEDIGSGDITTENTIGPDIEGKGIIIAKQQCVLSGVDVAMQVFETLDPTVRIEACFKDGDVAGNRETIMKITGNLRAMLMAERTALNFMQRLSGIATKVYSCVEILKGKNVRLVDTRKTAPGFRVLEKSAVRAGGAYNHRMGLYDGVLIKDNHIAVCGGIAEAVRRVRDRISHLVKIEVEVSDTEGVKEALGAGVDVIMLDNMNLERIREAVALINGKALIEVSGGITETSLADLADTGVDIISSGALTHSAGSVDLSMRISPL